LVHFKWMYMKEHACTQRIEYLSNKLTQYLKSGDKVFDLFCGYSPLCGKLLEDGYDLTGMDGCPEAIKWLKQNYPTGEWTHFLFDDKQETYLRDATVLLLLGVAEPQHHPEFQTYLEKTLNKNNVRIILTDTLKPQEKKPWYDGYTRNKQVMELCGYCEAETGLYETTEPLHHIRDYSIYVRNTK